MMGPINAVVSVHPLQERLLREIDEVVGDEPVSYEHLSQLQFLGRHEEICLSPN